MRMLRRLRITDCCWRSMAIVAARRLARRALCHAAGTASACQPLMHMLSQLMRRAGAVRCVRVGDLAGSVLSLCNLQRASKAAAAVAGFCARLDRVERLLRAVAAALLVGIARSCSRIAARLQPAVYNCVYTIAATCFCIWTRDWRQNSPAHMRICGSACSSAACGLDSGVQNCGHHVPNENVLCCTQQEHVRVQLLQLACSS